MIQKIGCCKCNVRTLILFFLFGLPMSLSNAGAAELWVDGTYTDPEEFGTPEQPFKTIQKALNSAVTADTVKVKPGVYEENVVITKSLTLSGSGPDTTIIRGAGGTTLAIGANKNVTVEKLTVTGSTGHGIYLNTCTVNSIILLKNVVSTSNSRDGFCQEFSCVANVLGINCTFTNNGENGVQTNKRSTFYNSIFTQNYSYNTDGYSTGTNYVNIVYCNCFTNGSENTNHTKATFSKVVDPLYMDASTGDYRLKSNSECRNAGSPGPDDRNPDGSRNDMGAYGGPGAAGFYDSYGSGPVVTNLHVSPGSVTPGDTISITATGKAQ